MLKLGKVSASLQETSLLIAKQIQAENFRSRLFLFSVSANAAESSVSVHHYSKEHN